MWRYRLNPRFDDSSNHDVDNDDNHPFMIDDDSDDDTGSVLGGRLFPFLSAEPPVCRFFTMRKGCRHGHECRNKHLSENGECLRCRQVLRLADVEAHCRAICDIRPVTGTINSNSNQRVAGTARFGTERFGTQRPTNQSVSPWEVRDRRPRDVTLGQTSLGQSSTLGQSSSLGQSSARGNPFNSRPRFELRATAEPTSPVAPHEGRSEKPRFSPVRRPLKKSQPPPTSSSSTSSSCPKTLWKTKNVCRFHLKGSCQFGSRCRNLHLVNNKCVLCEHVVAADAVNQHLRICTEYKILKDEMQKTEEIDCPICFSKLKEIPASGRAPSAKTLAEFPNIQLASNRFALLSDCGHLFCFKCIEYWKKNAPSAQENRYGCPLCTKKSPFAIPCNRAVEGQLRWQREKEIFMHFAKLQPCKNYKKGRCYVGSECLYAHVDNDAI